MGKWTTILIALLFVNCAEQDFDYENDQDVYYEYNYYEEADNMAIDKKNDATLVGRIITDDPEYPDGKYKPADLDAGVPIPDTGTPIRAKELADIDGFLGALLALGNLTPSGLADAPLPTVPADRGQYLTALTNWFLDGGLTINATTPTATSSSSELRPGQIGAVVFPPGATDPLTSYLESGGIRFSGWVGNGFGAHSAEAEIGIDLAELTVGTGVITYAPSGNLTMTGIVSTSRAIISCDLLLREDGVRQVVVPMTTSLLEGSTYLELNSAYGAYIYGTAAAYDSGILRIKYDPRAVEQPAP